VFRNRYLLLIFSRETIEPEDFGLGIRTQIRPESLKPRVRRLQYRRQNVNANFRLINLNDGTIIAYGERYTGGPTISPCMCSFL
jgi:hypothetical protein